MANPMISDLTVLRNYLAHPRRTPTHGNTIRNLCCSRTYLQEAATPRGPDRRHRVDACKPVWQAATAVALIALEGVHEASQPQAHATPNTASSLLGVAMWLPADICDPGLPQRRVLAVPFRKCVVKGTPFLDVLLPMDDVREFRIPVTQLYEHYAPAPPSHTPVETGQQLADGMPESRTTESAARDHQQVVSIAVHGLSAPPQCRKTLEDEFIALAKIHLQLDLSRSLRFVTAFTRAAPQPGRGPTIAVFDVTENTMASIWHSKRMLTKATPLSIDTYLPRREHFQRTLNRQYHRLLSAACHGILQPLVPFIKACCPIPPPLPTIWRPAPPARPAMTPASQPAADDAPAAPLRQLAHARPTDSSPTQDALPNQNPTVSDEHAANGPAAPMVTIPGAILRRERRHPRTRTARLLREQRAARSYISQQHATRSNGALPPPAHGATGSASGHTEAGTAGAANSHANGGHGPDEPATIQPSANPQQAAQ